MNQSHQQEAESLVAGQVLDDRFELLEKLGAGGFGEVWRARQLMFGHGFREVAVKLFKEAAVNADNALLVFEEASVLFGLQTENPMYRTPKGDVDVSHNVVRVYDIGVLNTPAPRAFMSMELVRGGRTLATFLKRPQPVGSREVGGLPPEKALALLRQMLVPLAWMHSLRPALVHGDLKPSNVLVNERDELVLTDFGLAARMPWGVVGGTPDYDAPEKLHQVPAAEASDIYSIGLIWYELLTGTHPFADVALEGMAAGDENAKLRAHREARKWPIVPRHMHQSGGRIPPVHEFNDAMKDHPQLEVVLARCLAFTPSDRYPNAGVLLDHIDNYMSTGELDPGGIALAVRATQPGPAGRTDSELQAKSTDAMLVDIRLLLETGEWVRARDTAERMIQANMATPRATLMKAEALARLGLSAEAVQEAETVRKMVEQADFLETKAAIHEVAGRPDVAKRLRELAENCRKAGNGAHP